MEIVSGNPTTVSGKITPDTLTLAQQDRENQGPWEAEYSYGGEADLHRHYDRCKKNPGHKNFISVDKFSIEDLPADYRDKDLVDYIRAVSDLTVRVSVKYVSDSRPATIPGSDKPYPGSGVSGQRRVTVGTGYMGNVHVENDSVRGPCKCQACLNSSTPETNFAIITIKTAAHVVFDELEAEHTTFHLFFDRGGTPETCSGVVTLAGVTCKERDVFKDDCWIKCYTHDLNLAHRLKEITDQVLELEEKLVEKWPEVKLLNQRTDVHDMQPLYFIVSHPHGCSKQVSIGHWEKAYMFDNEIVFFMYNTATCPGSSGARVCDVQECLMGVNNVIAFPVSHCGTSDVQPGYNYCKSLPYFTTDQVVILQLWEHSGEPWEDNFCCVEEEDQNQHYAACKKNPGHENFFPVEKFSMDNLPSFYRRDDVMELIKLASDLTVRVSVKYVSEGRPEDVPETDISYPWFSNRGSNLTRVGTGFVHKIITKHCENCKCKECRNSPQPKTSFAYIEIRTAAHLVYDELEAAHTICHLYFDSGETPDVCRNVVTLTDIKNFKFDYENDYCTFQYITHDMDLVDRLERMSNMYENKLYMLKKNGINSIKQNSGEDTIEEVPALYITVSHPHGCAKQISLWYFGKYASTEGSQFSCRIICSGISGAPLIDLSIRLVYPVVAKMLF